MPDWARPVEIRATAGRRGIRAALEIHHAAVNHVREQNIPRSLAGEEVSHCTRLVLNHEPRLDGLVKDLGAVRSGRSTDLTDQQVARGGDGRIPDAALSYERPREPAPGQVAEHRSSKSVRIELSRAVQHVGGDSLTLLRPRQMMFRRERAQGSHMIGVIQQGLGEIEHIPPAAAAPAPEPLGVVPP